MSIQAPAHETVSEDAGTHSAAKESTMQSTTGTTGTTGTGTTPKKPSLTYDGYPKPHLRGWIHACTAPLALAACIVLTILAPTAGKSWACAAYLACSLLLFTNSGVYHISNGHLSRRVSATLQSFDHSNIFLLIAGTYTPLSVALLSSRATALVLGIVWGGALLGIIKCLVWRSAPRWFSTVLYVALGWVAFWFLPQFWFAGGPAIVCLLVAGGLLYTIGGVIYVRQRPDPWPEWFGFHEIFHLCTVAGWACHCVACYLAILS